MTSTFPFPERRDACCLGRRSLLLLLLSALCSVPLAFSDDASPTCPVPIQRIQLPAARVPAELERVKRGVLVALPRAQFEEQVRRANAAGEALKNPPRLVEARYVAKLVDTALVDGRAEWKVVNPGAGPGILALQPFNLALLHARWPDNRDAVLGHLDGNDLGLIVDRPGASSLVLEWSARGLPAPPALRFSLDVPPCAIASLELDLPADRIILPPGEGYLLAGPLAAVDANRRTWRISCSGRGQIGFEVRRAGGTDLPAPLVLGTVQSRQELTPTQLQADFDFNLSVHHGSVRELLCECSPTLRPYEVTIRNLDSWELRPASGKGAPAVVVVRLREPFQMGQLLVRCVAPLPADRNWTAPVMRLTGAVQSSEELVVRVDPRVQLEDWQSGGFRLTRSVFQPDGFQVLSLAAGLDPANSQRPGGRVQTPGPAFKVRQLSWWNVGTEQAPLTAQLQYSVIHGRLFTLPVQLPPNWEVEHVETVPPDLLQHWTVASEKGRPTVYADLRRPLDPTSGTQLTIRARPTRPLQVPAGGLPLALPDVQPIGAHTREGALGVSVASLYQASATASLPSVPFEAADEATNGGTKTAPPAPARPPWAKHVLDYYYPFQGQAVEGTLLLRPRATQLRARCTTDVVIASGRALAIARLELRPEVGATQAIDLFISGDSPAPWEWKTVRGSNGVAHVQPQEAARLSPLLRLLAARNPWQAVAGLAPIHGSWWRLTFAQPLRDPVTLEASVELDDQEPAGDPVRRLADLGNDRPLEARIRTAAVHDVGDQAGHQRRWEVPLVSVPAADRFDGQLTLHLAGVDLVQVDSHGLREVVVPARRSSEPRGAAMPSAAPFGLSPSSSWRTFRYGYPPIGLTLRGGAPAADRSTEAVADHATLTTYLGPDGRLLHRFRFQVWNWRQQRLPVRLPSSVHLQSARSDSRWIGRLTPGETVDGTTTYELPVVPGTALHRFEIIYSSELPSWSLWTKLDAPAPALPLARTVALRRFWRLPQGVQPLSEGGLLRLPSSMEEGQGAPDDDTLALFTPSMHEATSRQDQLFTDAIAALHKQHRDGDDWPLAAVLERLVVDHYKDQALVLDMRALRAAGLRPSTPLGVDAWERPDRSRPPAAPWESLGLVYVAARPAAVLTTRQYLAHSPLAGSDPTACYLGMEEAIGEAAAFGHNRSGRFRTVLDWLQLYEQGEPALPPGTATDVWSPLGNGWTEWEPLAGNSSDTALLVVHEDVVPTIGLVLAGLLGLLALCLPPQTDRRRYRLVLAWLAVAGLALLWLPAVLRPLVLAPALVGVGVAALWIVRPVRLSANVAPSPAVAVGLVLVAVSALCGQVAAPPVPTIVYLVADAGGDAAKQRVLAPPALLQQLQTLEQRGVGGLHGALLLSASYDGRADGTRVAFQATFQVHCFSDEAATLTLPLGGVQLNEALLDGAAAYPSAQRQPRESYQLRVQGRGAHSVFVRFTVAVPAASDERELRFTIPELPKSHLTLRAPAAAGYLYAIDARGVQQTTTEGKLLRLEADLGAVKTLTARWHREDALPPPATVTVKEAYHWTIQPSTGRLAALLRYRVTRGWQQTFTIELPPELEVKSVEAGALPNGAAPPRLKEWLLRKKGAGRLLRLEFQHPVTRGMQVTLELVPRQPLGKNFILPLPTPLGAEQLQGFLAYRTEGVDAQLTQHHGIDKPTPKGGFTDSIALPWSQARFEELGEPTRSFSRSKGGFVRLSLTAPAVQSRCVHDVYWRIASRQVALHAAVRVSAPDRGAALVEWEVPAALAGVEVLGPQVHHWTRSGPRIQVWLQKRAAETTLQLNGWLPRLAKEQAQFTLQPLRLLNVTKQTSTIHVAGSDELIVGPGKLQNLTARPELGTPGREWFFEAEQDTYGGVFSTSPAVARADFRLLTFAEVQESELRLTATLHATIGKGELRNLIVTVRNWDGGEMVLTAPQVSSQVKKQTGATARAWLLDLVPGINKTYELTLTGKLPLGAAPALFLPDIRIETGGGPVPLQRWVAVAGLDLASEGTFGLAPALDRDLAPWPREANRLRRAGGEAWKVSADDWRLRLRPRSTPQRAAAVQVFLAEHAASVIDGRHWLHQATYWLFHEAGADLSVALPPGAAVLGVAIDGMSVPPLQPEPERLWLPLPGGAGVRRIRFNWSYPEEKETLAVPVLAAPRLEGVPDDPSIWVIAVPAGYQGGRRQAAKSAEASQPLSAAGLDLARAAAQLRLLSLLIERGRDSGDSDLGSALPDAQDRFERWCRRAEHQVLRQPARAPASGPAGQSLTVWLQELRAQDDSLTRSPIYARSSADARNRSVPVTAATDAVVAAQALWLVSPFESGRPLFWQASSSQTAPLLRLVPEEAGHYRHALTASTLLLILLFSSWILWRSFRGAAWPEQLTLLAAIGWCLFGPALGLALLVLPGIAVGYRLMQLGRWVQSRLPARPAPVDGSHSSFARSGSSAKL